MDSHLINRLPATAQVGPQSMYIREESGCCERICCGPNRSLTLHVHEGHDQTGNVIMQIHKSFGLTGLCCCRPEVMIFDGLGEKIGAENAPFEPLLY